jgi:hypothetical protein
VIVLSIVSIVQMPNLLLYGNNSVRYHNRPGAGGEWMFLPNWSVKLECMYYRLGNKNNNNGTLLLNSFTATTAGINYIVEKGKPLVNLA